MACYACVFSQDRMNIQWPSHTVQFWWACLRQCSHSDVSQSFLSRNCQVLGRAMWMHASFCRELIVLPGACICSLDTYFNLAPIHYLFYLAKFLTKHDFVFKYILGFLNCWNFIIHALLPGTSKAFTLSVFCWAHMFMSFCQAHNIFCNMSMVYFHSWSTTEARETWRGQRDLWESDPQKPRELGLLHGDGEVHLCGDGGTEARNVHKIHSRIPQSSSTC